MDLDHVILLAAATLMSGNKVFSGSAISASEELRISAVKEAYRLWKEVQKQYWVEGSNG